LFELDEREKKK